MRYLFAIIALVFLVSSSQAFASDCDLVLDIGITAPPEGASDSDLAEFDHGVSDHMIRQLSVHWETSFLYRWQTRGDAPVTDNERKLIDLYNEGLGVVYGLMSSIIAIQNLQDLGVKTATNPKGYDPAEMICRVHDQIVFRYAIQLIRRDVDMEEARVAGRPLPQWRNHAPDFELVPRPSVVNDENLKTFREGVQNLLYEWDVQAVRSQYKTLYALRATLALERVDTDICSMELAGLYRFYYNSHNPTSTRGDALIERMDNGVRSSSNPDGYNVEDVLVELNELKVWALLQDLVWKHAQETQSNPTCGAGSRIPPYVAQ